MGNTKTVGEKLSAFEHSIAVTILQASDAAAAGLALEFRVEIRDPMTP
jgi:hypothetical protein